MSDDAFPPPDAALTGAFRAFYEHYGPTLCGPPLGGVQIEGGVPTQYFRHLALEEPVPGRIRLKALGAAWLAERAETDLPAPNGALPVMVNLVGQLARGDAHSYANRPLSDIRYLVIHHSGAPAELGPHAIAREHVERNGWPGIGYHFVIGIDGTAYRTQDLTVVSHHAAQFNPVAVGIALAGDWSQAEPPPEQLAATAQVLAELCDELGISPRAIRGHREMVPTSCPGELFLSTWKPRLVRSVTERLAAARRPAGLEAAALDEPVVIGESAVIGKTTSDDESMAISASAQVSETVPPDESATAEEFLSFGEAGPAEESLPTSEPAPSDGAPFA